MDGAKNPQVKAARVAPRTEPAVAMPVVGANEQGGRFQSLFNASPLGKLVLRAADATVIEVNAAFCRMFGYERADLVGRPAAGELHLWADGGDRERLLAAILRDGRARDVDARFRRRDGEIRLAQLSAEPVPFDDMPCLLVSVVDITAARQTEQALRRSEESYAALVSNMPHSVAHCRLVYDGARVIDFEFLRVNPAFATLTGWSGVVGRRVSEYVPDYARRHPQTLAQLARVAATGEIGYAEDAVDGGRRWVAHTAYRLPSREIVLVSEDITQRRLAEQDTRAQQRKLHTALNSMTDAVFISDVHGNFSDFNEAFVSFHRFPSRAQCATALADYPALIEVRRANGRIAPLEEWAVPRALRGEVCAHEEYRLRRRDTGECWTASYSFAPIRDPAGGIVGAVAVGRDVSVQRQNEDRLRTLGLVVEQAPSCVLITDLAGRVEYANASFRACSGYGNEELIGRGAALIVAPQTPRRLRAAIRNELRRGRIWRGNLELRTRDSRGFPVSATIHPVLGSDGCCAHYALVAEDIAERRRLDAELRQHRLHLEMLVEQRTDELAQARDVAEAAASAKSEFLANMSHEVRTPLNAVLGVAQVALRDAPDTRTETAFRRILASGRQLLGLLNDILDLSKIDAQKLALELQPVVVDDLLADLREAWGDVARAKHVDLSTQIGAGMPVAFRSDPLRLGQILSNLVSNAIKFTDHGSVRVGAGVDGDFVVFCVTDTGIGIRAIDRDRLFEPFEQADRSTTRRYGGTGLGLSICRRLVELLGGRISVASEVGAGSTFTVRLPLVRVPPPACTRAPEPAAASLVGLRILGVEDNALSRAVLEDGLRAGGADVVVAQDGREAVAIVERAGPGAFDVVLMDVQMPELDGQAATALIHAVDPDLPVIGQTAYTHREEHERCRACGMVDVVTKPINFDELPGLVCRHARPRR